MGAGSVNAALAPFFTDFAVNATWSVGAKTVKVIHDTGFQAAELGLLAGVEGVRRTALVATADMPTAAHGETLTIGSTAYVIRGVQPDGTGVTLLLLQDP